MKDLIEKVKNWGDSKGITKKTNEAQMAQFDYVHKELTEAQDALKLLNTIKKHQKDKKDYEKSAEVFALRVKKQTRKLKDELGDVLVTLINYSCTRSEFELIPLALESYEAMKRIATKDDNLNRLLILFRVSLNFGQQTNVLFTNFCTLLFRAGYDPKECLDIAYTKIKDREGKTIDGQFVKD